MRVRSEAHGPVFWITIMMSKGPIAAKEIEMKLRKEVARFIEEQMDETQTKHYGWVELRELMDFVYEAQPNAHEEKLNFKRLQCLRDMANNN